MIPWAVFFVHAEELGDLWATPRWLRMNEGAEAKEKVKATAAAVGGEVGRAGLGINVSRLRNKNAAVLDNGRKPVPRGG